MKTKEGVLMEYKVTYPDGSGYMLENTPQDKMRGIKNAMDEYAKQQAIAFAEWKISNRWFTYENGYWHYTFEQGTAMSEAAYNKNFRKTTDQLYAQFIESQNQHK